MAQQRTAHQQGNMTRRRSGGWVSHSLRRRKHSDRSPVNPCLKHTLFLVNFFIMMLSLAIVIFTSYILVEKDKKVKSIIDFLFDPACLLCLFGCIALVVSFLGCGGGLRENTCFLKAYYYILNFLLLLEIVAVILVFVFFFVDESFASMGDFEDFFEDTIRDYRNDADVQGTIDNIQDILSCCGASNDEMGYKDWNENIYFRCNESNPSPERCSVPFSCCKIQEGDNINYQCGQGMLDPGADTSDIYVNGCIKGLDIAIQDNIWYIGGGVLGVLLPQITLIFFASALVSQIEEQKMKW